MHGLQVPPDGAKGESSLFPRGGDQAEQVDAQTLFPQDYPGQVRMGRPALLTDGVSPYDEDVLSDCCRNHRDINDLPGSLHPAPSQAGTALWAGCQGVLHPVGGSHALAGEAVGLGLPGAVLARWLLACGRLDTRHSARTTGLGLSFQNFDPPLQLGDDGLLLLDYRLLLSHDPWRNFSGSAVQVQIGIHATCLT